ncbi:nicotinate-nucleotide pyrophosphorylase [carboxylating] [Lachnotalea glycerini]|jgi:nicotinate-nucleotide pyrophosphorylase (carboxylating)|uniref:Probable nicotinate-nucleotide pyrophosphorylase [carboxylating] n=1 Tax=Lachnotalea glycerini TaxID=1763509 RepID=A0A255INT4_9FIRM|nr:carboxylating nicotinate-nucleotide diphosphorylase [Lachnotalea glycerini]PXV85669.1 nicotinate-nucleotide pyrophosphorylase [carboxylating] [Lachnotalea glycerini]RDY31347.1 carboxylating nicotinate-nucleotide diphosphorylase [Lachnotalea glycerini]
MINGVNLKVNIDEYLLNALREDITNEDVTTNAVMREEAIGEAELICKEDGIICGLGVFERVFQLLDSNIVFETSYKDADRVKNKELIGVIEGDIRAILSGERTALNYLQRMSGIATITNEYVKELKDYKTKLLDTRKTTPNMRLFEKYAVTVGGGANHRYNLSDGILLKDNHIGAAGSVTRAVKMAREYAPFVRKIEVEVETLEMVKEALEAKADIVMLDNMSNEDMAEAVRIIHGKAQTECSGNVTKERLLEIAEIGVDFVSCGALTHSAPILDFSLKNLHPKMKLQK